MRRFIEKVLGASLALTLAASLFVVSGMNQAAADSIDAPVSENQVSDLDDQLENNSEEEGEQSFPGEESETNGMVDDAASSDLDGSSSADESAGDQVQMNGENAPGDIDAVEESEESNAASSEMDDQGQEAVDDDESIEDSFYSEFRGNSVRYNEGVPVSDNGRATLLSWKKNPDGSYTFSNNTTVSGANAIGVDVSTFNGSIDWGKVKASGVDFAIIRMGYGSGGEDATFLTNVKGAQKAGIRIGVYLYSYAWDADTANAEALWALSLLKEAGLNPDDLDLPVYYDLENTDQNGNPSGMDTSGQYRPINGRFAAIAQEFADTLSDSGYEVGIYSFLNWWNTNLTDSCFDSWSKWVAQWNTECTYAGTYDYWQRTDHGAVDGISGSVDINFEYDQALSPEDHISDLKDGSYSIRVSNSSSAVLDVQGASNNAGAYVNLWSRKSTGDNQIWNVTHDDSGYVTFTNASSGFVLGIKGDAVKNARTVQVEQDATDLSQKWIVVRKGNSYTIHSAANTSLTLDASRSSTANGTWVALYPQNGGSNQTWVISADYTLRGRLDQLAKENVSVLPDGDYAIHPSYAKTMCLDVQGASTSAGAKVNLWTYGGRTNQVWTVSHDSDGYVILTNYKSQKVLDSAAASTMGQGAWQDAWSQKWIAVKSGSNIMLVSAENDQYVLDVRRAGSSNGTETILYSKSGAANQLWIFESVYARRGEINDLAYKHASDLPNGTYYFSASTASSAVIDVQGASLSNSANVNIWTYDGSPNQAWKVSHDKKGYITITNVYSGKVLDVQGAKDSSGARLVQYSSNGGWNQKWIAVKEGSSIKLVSAMSGGYVLGRAGGKTSNGTQIKLCSDDGSSAIMWNSKSYTLKPNQYPYKGYQNSAGYYQVSNHNVSIKNQGSGIHGYASASQIGWRATRQECINTMITRAMDYLGTPYRWDYSCAPGVGVDCAGLVMQALYATGMNLSPMNPWDHFYTPGHDAYANYMWNSGKFQKLSFSKRERGDIVSWPGHVAIYLGNNQIIEANGRDVHITSVYAYGTPRGVLRPYLK